MPRHILHLIVGRDDGAVLPYYGIEHEGKLWLVTAWLINRATQKATPERMIRVDSRDKDQHPVKCDPGDDFDYANILLPKAVIEGVSQDAQGFEVRSLPDSPVVDARDLKTLPSIFPKE